MSRRSLRNALLGLSLGLAPASLVPACSRPERSSVDSSSVRPERLDMQELHERLWPEGDERWAPPREHQLVALENLIELLARHAERGTLGPRQRLRARTLATLAGVELAEIELSGDTQVSLWLVTEPATNRRGRGSYLFRRGEPAGREGVEFLIQAPHSRFDRHTGEVALDLFVHSGEHGVARALFINSVHRFRKTDGERARLSPPAANAADAAHAAEHPLARVSKRVLRSRPWPLVQIHGFSRSAEAGDPQVIVSSGGAPTVASLAMSTRLTEVLSGEPVGHFGVDTDRLGATTNVQGHAARETRRCFIHVELSHELRERLLAEDELARAFGRAILDGQRKEFVSGCRR